MKYITINYDECRGCNSCALACSFTNTKIKEFNITRSNISTVMLDDLLIPVLCLQCLEPLCMEACPQKAIYQDNKTGLVIIDKNLCIGCKKCTMVCPFGGPRVDSQNGKIMKCDLCGGDPQCVKYCGYGALQYVTEDEALMKQRKKGARKIRETF